MLYKILFYFFIPLLLMGACSNNFKLKNYELGSNLNPQGNISNKSLDFKFKNFNKSKKYRDLFNYIYFEGDTVCVSFEFSQKINKEQVNIWFINPITKKKYNAERIDFFKNKIYGFSLVGSLLEHFQYMSLNKKLTEFNNPIEVSFEILLHVKTNNNLFTKKIPSSFTVFY